MRLKSMATLAKKTQFWAQAVSLDAQLFLMETCLNARETNKNQLQVNLAIRGPSIRGFAYSRLHFVPKPL